MAGAAYLLIDQYMDQGYWISWDRKERAEKLTERALEIAPMAEDTLRAKAYLLRAQGRWRDAIAAARRMIEMFPNVQTGYVVLGLCETYTGNAAAEIALNETLLRISPRSPHLFNFHRRIGFASLMLGRDEDAIAFLERSLALHPDASVNVRQRTIRQTAVAHARLGHDGQARRALAEANGLWPFDTVRGQSPVDLRSATAAEQIRSYQEGLRLAGLRDHADEDADFGIPPDSTLRMNRIGYTPLTTPGAPTIRTADLPTFIAERRPLVIDLLINFWGYSIPGAIGLKNAGIGGTFSDGAQDRLRQKMTALMGGDLGKPIVTVGWNSERFEGRNLALRLVALGYTNVYWYRGGREAWEVNGLPETEVDIQEW
jgi:tetratricopeptide (TPR) repeat protein